MAVLSEKRNFPRFSRGFPKYSLMRWDFPNLHSIRHLVVPRIVSNGSVTTKATTSGSFTVGPTHSLLNSIMWTTLGNWFGISPSRERIMCGGRNKDQRRVKHHSASSFVSDQPSGRVDQFFREYYERNPLSRQEAINRKAEQRAKMIAKRRATSARSRSS